MVVAVERAGVTRYRLLETLRAYGRERPSDGTTALARRHAAYYVGLAEEAARGRAGRRRAGLGRARRCRTSTTCGPRSSSPSPTATSTWRLRLVASLPELTHLRGGYEAAGGPSGSLDLADPDHPLFAAAVGAAARGAWNVGDFARARRARRTGRGPRPRRGHRRASGHPADVAADVALYEGDVDRRAAHYTAEVERARRDGDRIRLVWTLYYVAICRRRAPGARARASPRRRRACAVAEETGQPDRARRWPATRWAWCSRSPSPDRALALFDEAARAGRGRAATSGGRASR